MSNENETLPGSLPTAAALQEWREALDRLVIEETAMKERHAAEERAIRARRMKLEKLVSAAGAFLDAMDAGRAKQVAAQESNTSAPTEKLTMRRGAGKSWTATIRQIVESADRRLTYQEIKSEVAKTHLGETLSRTEKAFYGGIGKLAERDQIIRHKGWIFSVDAFNRHKALVDQGEATDEFAPTFTGGKTSPNEIAVRRYLTAHPEGVTSAMIVDHLLNSPPADLAVSKNKNSIYNLLSREVERKKLVRRANKFYLPKDKNEAPDSNEPGAPKHHGGGRGGPSSSGNGRLRGPVVALPSAISAHSGE